MQSTLSLLPQQFHLHSRVVPRPAGFKLVKDTVVLVEITEFGLEVIVDVVDLNRPPLVADIPDLLEPESCQEKTPPVNHEEKSANSP